MVFTMKRNKFEVTIQALAFILTVAVIVTAVLRYKPFSNRSVKMVEAKANASFILPDDAYEIPKESVTDKGMTQKQVAAAVTSEPSSGKTTSAKTTGTPTTTAAPVLTIPPTQTTAYIPPASSPGDPQYVYVNELEYETIPFNTEYRYSEALPVGEEEVLQYGVDGTVEIQYQSAYLDGVLVEKNETGRNVTVEPLTYIIIVGTAEAADEIIPEESSVFEILDVAVENPEVIDEETQDLTEDPEQNADTLMQVFIAETDPPEVEEEAEIPEVEEESVVYEEYIWEDPYAVALPPVYEQMVQSLGFSAPGSIAATEANLSIVKSLMNINGSQHYVNYVDNGDGTITVDGVTLAYSSVSSMKITSYDGYECAKLSGFAYGDCNPTATGILAQRGIVAAAFDDLPFGTVVFIEDYGIAVVGDRHGMGPGLIDVSMDPREIEAGIYVTTGNRNVYIISAP